MFALILTKLKNLVNSLSLKRESPTDRVAKAKKHFLDRKFSRKEYLKLFPDNSTATASRDLKKSEEGGMLNKTRDKALASYIFGNYSAIFPLIPPGCW